MENNLREWKKLIEDCGEINSTASEHDHEASMARGQLYHVAKDAIKLIKMIEKGDELEGWVASKITKAKETISVVADYMEAEMTVNNNDLPEDAPMNKYGLSAKNKDGKFYSYKDGKLTGTFDSMEELAKHQEELLGENNTARLKQELDFNPDKVRAFINNLAKKQKTSALSDKEKQDFADAQELLADLSADE